LLQCHPARRTGAAPVGCFPEMPAAAKGLDFERAQKLRDEIMKVEGG
jgi:hypothetical protein